MIKKYKMCVRLLLTLLMSCTILGFGIPAQAAYDYQTKAYNVDVQVNKNQSFDITETIQVNFPSPQHGIYRYIPIKGAAYVDQNGTTVKKLYRAIVSNVTVTGENVTLSTENDYRVIRIGKEKEMVSGAHTYTIHYRYTLYADQDTSKDQVYINLIPNNWESPIESAQVTMHFPKEFPVNYMNIFSGEYGNSGNSAMNFDYKNQTLTASSNRPLAYHEGATVRVDLPEGYFSNVKTMNQLPVWMLIVSLGVAVLSFLLWYFFGKDKKIIPTVEFYPPDGMTSAEIGYVVDGKVDDKDLISLILYWAEKGYMTIDEEAKGKVFRFTKIRDLDEDAKPYQQTMFNGIFKTGDSVLLSDLKEKFYPTFSASKAQLQAFMEGRRENRAFTVSSQVARFFGVILTLLPLLTVNILSGYIRIQNDVLHYIIAALLSILLLGAQLCFVFLNDTYYSVSKSVRVSIGILGTVLLVLSIVGLFVNAGLAYTVYSLIAILSTLISLFLTMLMHKRTLQSSQKQAKILGLRTFILEAEADRLKLLCDENPHYFYHILPYAYVLGISDKWAKNFKSLAITPPEWYNGGVYNGSMFNAMIFTGMMTQLHSDVRSNFTYVPPSQVNGGGGGIGGFGGGGGFSGGGFGGGGGGSW